MRFRSSLPRFTGLLLAACLIPIAGCGADEPAARIAVDTLAGGAVRVQSPEAGLWGPDEAWRTVEQLRIGRVDGAEPYVFGSVRDVSLGADGRLYVLDNQAKQVRIFDAEGRHLRTVGGEGGGPGEFRHPTGMTWGPAGNLWVVDVRGQRYTVLTPDGDLVSTRARSLGGWGAYWAGAFDDAGRLYEPGSYRDRATGESRRVYIRHALRGDEVVATDTFELPRHDARSYRVELENGSMVIAVPFAPALTWGFDGRDGFWVGTGERYRLWHRTLDGDTLRIAELERSRPPVTGEDRTRARRRIEGYLEGRGGLDQVDFSRIPDRKPAHGPLVVDDRGWVWVARTPPTPPGEGEGPNPTTFDVFDPVGRYHGALTVDVAMRPPPVVRGDRIVGVAYDELGVQRVVVHRIEGRGADAGSGG